MADSLIECNGIISERLAGTLRYLDSMEEEQRRGITMRTSAIGLKHIYQTKEKGAAGTQQQQDMVIHLLDSPGHVDFAPEVSSALQSCDGALLVVDVVEGMCARTHQVLREAYRHQLVPILVLNKVDRLCLELCLTPTEAYLRLRGLLESVNAASAAMLNSRNAQDGSTNDLEEASWVFEPQKGNVVFGSALYGWGFAVPKLAKSLFRAKTLPIKPMLLKQYLFGDFKYTPEGKVLKWKGESDDLEPIFAQFALQPLWNIYEGVSNAILSAGLSNDDGRGSAKKNEYKLKASQLQFVLSELQTGGTGSRIPTCLDSLQQLLARTGASSADAILSCLLRRYRPLSDAVLDAVCDHCPAPHIASSQVRTRALALTLPSGEATEEFLHIQSGVQSGEPSGPTVAYIGKFLSTDRSHVRDHDIGLAETLILGLARVLSGTLKVGDLYYCMGHKHMYGTMAPQRSVRLYLLMGSSFVPVKEVPAGHLCAVYGLEELHLKTVTLCESPHGMPLQGFDRGVRPLVKVSIEAVSPEDTDALEEGLLKLSLADAAVEVTATAKGERLLACLGEIHLEQSILELQTTYCGKKDIQLRISEPIVEFAETTEWFPNEEDYGGFLASHVAPLRQTRIPPYNDEEGISLARRGRMRVVLSGRSAAMGIRVVPLSALVYESFQSKTLVDGSENDIVTLGKALGLSVNNTDDLFETFMHLLISTDDKGNALIEGKGIRDGSCVCGVVASGVFVAAKGPQGKVDENDDETVILGTGEKEFQALEAQLRDQPTSSIGPADDTAMKIWTNQMRGSADAGFHLGTMSGPICEEQVQGILVILETVEVALQNDGSDSSFSLSKPLSGGMVVASLRQGIRCGLLSRPSRLMEGHLKLTLHSSLTGLGPLYAVLSKRRGKTLVESMVDGTDLILIEASIPQAESFGLAPELLQKTSGEVTLPEMTFLRWERLDEDPFWIPTSLEEREDFGEIGISGDSSTGIDNTAIKYIRVVRERKGLLVDSNKTVIAAEKQRTMKK